MKPFLTAALVLAASPTLAEDWTMPWQEDASFAAYSTTAESVTGDLSISGSETEKVLTTADGTEIGLSFVEDRSSGWNLNDNEVWPGGVFAIDEDPGALVNGNTLCGAEAATYLVFTPLDDTLLQMAVFSGEAPENIESPGLCGTYNYSIE
ncbi:MAG: hypothetical protein JNN06_08205 [Gemmobacter sp.]|uniref:hypothetical protein n=1 Tax=Gemmobacter sp. TaxID=1898957 RepID=UPI001A3B59D1|nr:hypothetical protein [Gemmobacter sp.]MBL8562249.1 hypothetical protein [Gemmobacter sp.]